MNYVIYALIALSYFFSFYKIFEKNGIPGWKALIPVYGVLEWLKLIQKPWWWIFLLMFPGVNIIMLGIMSANTATVHGKRTTNDMLLAGFLPFYYLPKLALDEKLTYVGPVDRKKNPKNTAQEWRDAILFAIVAASIIRAYFFEAFTIPTSSMEKTLLKGDFLFVSKMHYGAKVPQTPLSFPFTHHSFPVINTQSYLDWIELPYFRLPGFSDVERNDVVVFNYPEGDTVDVELQSNMSFEAMVRSRAIGYKIQDFAQQNEIASEAHYRKLAHDALLKERAITVRPVDKRENYIKRCVAVPGDVLEIKAGMLYINGELAEKPTMMQYKYLVETANPIPFRSNKVRDDLKSKYLIDYEDQNPVVSQLKENKYLFPLTAENAKALEREENISSVSLNLNYPDKFDAMTLKGFQQQYGKDARIAADFFQSRKEYNPDYNIFPNDPDYNWTEDFFGPLTIPKAGTTVELTPDNLPLYERVISVYEGNELYVRDGTIYINDQPATSYTFAMNYYWLMGDNRHNSADSRFWGFVPENHVVGKAVLVWLSLDPELGLFDGKIRWDRLFSFID